MDPQLPHYEPITLTEHGGPEGTWILFYGGPFSNFVGGPHLIEYPQPWHDRPTFKSTYWTVEHFYQSTKASSRYDHEFIMDAATAGEAKGRGNADMSWEPGQARNSLLRPDWETCKYNVMLAGVRAKFSEKQFRDFLVDTADLAIAEDSPSDFIWGIRDANGGFTGQNLLGRALMQVRTEIRHGL